MGTVFSFHIWPGKLSEHDIASAMSKARLTLTRHDEIFSTYKPDSPIIRIQKGELPEKGTLEEIDEVSDLCQIAKSLSGGWFDPWAGPYGFDPTGLVKGWSVQKVARLIFSYNPKAVIVNGGGDISCLGEPPPSRWQFAVAHPWRKDAAAAVVEVKDTVATSGRYERGEHFFDPIGFQGTKAISATVLGPDLALADALATGLAVGGEEAFEILSRIKDYGFYLIDINGKELYTDNVTFIREP